MSHSLTLAVLRMDAAPAPTETRLARAEELVRQAAAQGAQIAVLPEVFNTGYEYSEKNYARAESSDGPSVDWMKSAAQRHGLHVAGSLLLRDTDGIYNAMLLAAPDGATWRYDKSYPWAWERAYFRPRKDPLAVAETALGKIGMLVCWDVAHTGLWAQYAGQVDLMLVSSCPPRVHTGSYHLPDGRIIDTSTLGPMMKAAYSGVQGVFGEFLRRQAAWLGVPLAHTTASGQFKTGLPRAQLSFSVLFAGRPDLWKYLPQADKIKIASDYFDETCIADASGRVLQRAQRDGDDLAVAQVTLGDAPPRPSGKQPAFGMSPMAYLADEMINALLGRYYEQRWKNR